MCWRKFVSSLVDNVDSFFISQERSDKTAAIFLKLHAIFTGCITCTSTFCLHAIFTGCITRMSTFCLHAILAMLLLSARAVPLRITRIQSGFM